MNTARFGPILKTHRKAKRLSMYRLGMELHLSEMTVCRYESGQRQIPPDLLIVWAEYLGVSCILHEVCADCPFSTIGASKQDPPNAV